MLDNTMKVLSAFCFICRLAVSALLAVLLWHCNTLPGWQYTGQMTAGGQCSPLRRNFLLSFLIIFFIFYSIISIFYNAR